VSPNIVDASFRALVDSITYRLVTAGAEPGAACAPARRLSA